MARPRRRSSDNDPNNPAASSNTRTTTTSRSRALLQAAAAASPGVGVAPLRSSRSSSSSRAASQDEDAAGSKSPAAPTSTTPRTTTTNSKRTTTPRRGRSTSRDSVGTKEKPTTTKNNPTSTPAEDTSAIVDTGTVILPNSSTVASASASSLKRPQQPKLPKTKLAPAVRNAPDSRAAFSDQEDHPDDTVVGETSPTTTTTTTTKPAEKPAPTVDVMVHRMRHCDYHPQPILCLAATPMSTSSNNNSSCLLAVSRASGSVTVKVVHPKLRTVARVAGHATAPMTSLCWVVARNSNHDTTTTAAAPHPPILVGAARHELGVVDFRHTQQWVARTASGGGGILALERIHSTAVVATACQDGAIRLFRLECHDHHHYQLLHVATLPSTGAPVLSLACAIPRDSWNDNYQNDNPDDFTGAVLFAGVADGTIRRFDCLSSSSSSGGTFQPRAPQASAWKSTLRMTVECQGRSTPTRVWALKVTPDGDTLISGDSLGHVQFWDARAGTLSASLRQNEHQADVLVLAVVNGQQVFASGVDSRVVCLERQQQQSGSHSGATWVVTHAQRPHTHDVKAMCLVPVHAAATGTSTATSTTTSYDAESGGTTSMMLCTGGVDTKLCTYSTTAFGRRRPRSLYPWPSSISNLLQVAPQARWLTMRREDRLDVYLVATSHNDNQHNHMVAPQLVPETESVAMGTVQVTGMRGNLSCSAISTDGQFLALSDSFALLLFHLDRQGQTKTTFVPRPIAVPTPLNNKNQRASIAVLQFVQPNLLLVATTDGSVRIVLLSAAFNDSDDSAFHAAIVQTLDPPPTKTLGVDGTESTQSLLPIHNIVVSDNGKWFLTHRNSSSAGDGRIDVYRTMGGDDSTDSQFQFWWSLPQLNCPVTAVAFLPTTTTTMSEPKLAVAGINFALYTFHVEHRCLADWSERAGFPVELPAELACRQDFPVRIAVNPGSPSVALLGSFGAIVSMNTAIDFPKECRIFPERHVRKRKRSASMPETNASGNEVIPSACTMCLRYNSMLCMDFVGEHEMVVVEQPWLSVVATFPDALQRKVYGT